jgi:hypothetical protein
MVQPNASAAWIVTLVIVVVVFGVLLGTALSRTDLLNPNTSTAAANAQNAITDVQHEKDMLGLELYRAEIETKKAAEIAVQKAQQQAAAFQVVKNMIDQQAYRVQQMAQAMRQVADAKQYEAQQLVRAEAERQKHLADIEIQRERALAEIHAQEQSQVQTRAEQAERAAQDLKSATLLSTAVALAVIIIAIAVAAVFILGAVTLTRSRLQRARLELATVKAKAPQPIQAIVPEPTRITTAPTGISDVEREYRKQQRVQARAVEIAMRSNKLEQQVVQQPPLVEQNPTAQDVGTWFRKSGKQPIVASEPEQPARSDG